MSGMQAAASLFGPDDAGDDPFAAFAVVDEAPAPAPTAPLIQAETQPVHSFPQDSSSAAAPAPAPAPPVSDYSGYNPYAPQQQQQQQPQHAQKPSYQTQSSYGQQTQYAPAAYANYAQPSYVAQPPPPVPAAPIVRSTSTNAYDPPFPISSRSRKPSSRPALTSQTYSSYNAYTPPQPPAGIPLPPPGRTSTLTPPTAGAYTPYSPQNTPQAFQPPPPPTTTRAYSPYEPQQKILPPQTSAPPPPAAVPPPPRAYSPYEPKQNALPPSPQTVNGFNDPSKQSAYPVSNGYTPRTSSPLAAIPSRTSQDALSDSPAQMYAPTRTSLEKITPTPPPVPAERTGSPALRYALNRSVSPSGIKPSANGTISTPVVPFVPEEEGVKTVSPSPVVEQVDFEASPGWVTDSTYVAQPSEGLDLSSVFPTPDASNEAPPAEATYDPGVTADPYAPARVSSFTQADATVPLAAGTPYTPPATDPYAPPIPRSRSTSNGSHLSYQLPAQVPPPLPVSTRNPYAPPPTSNVAGNSYAPPPRSTSVIQDPYAPPTTIGAGSPPHPSYASSPASSDMYPAPGYSPYSPPSASASYSPANPGAYASPPPPMAKRSHSGSNASLLSVATDPYGAPGHRAEASDPSSDYGGVNQFTSRYNYPQHDQASVYAPSHGTDPSQEVEMQQTISQYAPSPSLMGTNDPLLRSSRRIPVFNFGYGGKIITCFHGADQVEAGFDVALASRNSTAITIRSMSELVPESALDISPSSFPGPLFGDNVSSSIVVAIGSNQNKTKKVKLNSYLQDRIEEIDKGINYMSLHSPERRRNEGKLVLFKLLKLLVEHDGRFPPACDKAVRTSLVPSLESDDSGSSATFTPAATFSPLHVNDPSDIVIATTSTKRSSLDKIQNFLLRGERRQAYNYALDEKLWSHAMVIASSLDRESWKEVATEFLKGELGTKVDTSSLKKAEEVPIVNGLESLRVAYSLFAGHGSQSVQELVPPNLLARPGAKIPAPAVSHLTPMTPNFAAPIATANVPEESLTKWNETLAMMYSSPLTPETSAAITALGDQLLSNGWVEAAHTCYLLSPQTSIMSGLGNPSARLILVGSPSPQISPNFVKDPDSIIMSEVAEFAYSLHVPPKGQEPFKGFPHLQAYRFIRATILAELGQIQLSNRYCDAISASLNQPSPYFSQLLVDQLKELMNRNAGISHPDKSSGWASKLSKPSLDGVAGWFESGFTKLVTGDEIASIPEEEKDPATLASAGPFSHYSAISSTTTSTSTSPAPSLTNMNTLPPAARPSNGNYSPFNSNPAIQIDRASSAMDTTRRKSSPVHRIASANALTTSFAQAHGGGAYQPLAGVSSSNIEDDGDQEGQEVSWWGSTSNMATPTAPSFSQVNNGDPSASTEGFVSLMDDSKFGIATSTTTSYGPSSTASHEEDDDDLGFGNASSKKKVEAVGSSSEGKTEAAAANGTTSQRPDAQPVQGADKKGWFSWWGSKEGAKPGPIKANLGEQSSFYYDKDLKKWVNKKAGDDDSSSKALAPPAPPSRSQTASPGASMGRGRPPPMTSGTPPPPPPQRAASVADMPGANGTATPPPPKSVMRIRSNLVPTEGETISAPGTPTGISHLTALSDPTANLPPSRPRSSAAKKKPRYAQLT